MSIKKKLLPCGYHLHVPHEFLIDLGRHDIAINKQMESTSDSKLSCLIFSVFYLQQSSLDEYYPVPSLQLPPAFHWV